MTEEQKKLEKEVANAIAFSINKMGKARFKQTSFFISNWRMEILKKAA